MLSAKNQPRGKQFPKLRIILLIAASWLLLLGLGMTSQAESRFFPDSAMLTILVVFFWAVHLPRFFPVTAALAMGLSQDLLGGAPVGIVAFSCVVTHFLAIQSQLYHPDSKSRFFFALVQQWIIFALAMLCLLLLAYLLLKIAYGGFVPFLPVLSHIAQIIAWYPVFAVFLYIFLYFSLRKPSVKRKR